MVRNFLVIVVLLFVTAAFAIFFFDRTSADSQFNSEIWKAQQYSTEANNPRAAMIADLEKNYLRKGMTRAEIEGLLGEPDTIRAIKSSSTKRHRYNLGSSPYGIDHDFFIIEIDSSDKAVDFYFGRS